MNIADSTGSVGSTIAEGSVSVLALAFLHDTLTLMTPFFIVAAFLIVADLYFGIAAAKKRGEKIRFSRALRRTVNKGVEYACWVILSASLAVAFDYKPLNWILLAVVIGNEMISITTNWLYVHGKKVSGLQKFLLGLLGKKLDADTSEIIIEDVKQPRDSMGRFTKKS